jgi:hypothetical protein
MPRAVWRTQRDSSSIAGLPQAPHLVGLWRVWLAERLQKTWRCQCAGRAVLGRTDDFFPTRYGLAFTAVVSSTAHTWWWSTMCSTQAVIRVLNEPDYGRPASVKLVVLNVVDELPVQPGSGGGARVIAAASKI